MNTRDIFYHQILPRRYVAGALLDRLSSGEGMASIDSMSHIDYFKKYLRTPEGANRLLAAIKTNVQNIRPDMKIVVLLRNVPHLSGVNALAKSLSGENIPQIVLIFESFPDGAANSAGATGHFMLMWNFPATFNKKLETTKKFYLFDSFGRDRKADDPQEYYYQNTKRCYQDPSADTCGMWTIYALWHWCLKCNSFKNIHYIEYGGREAQLGNPIWREANQSALENNEFELYKQLILNGTIFQRNIKDNRPLS